MSYMTELEENGELQSGEEAGFDDEGLDYGYDDGDDGNSAEHDENLAAAAELAQQDGDGAITDPDAPEGDDDKQQELDFGGEEEFGGRPNNDNAPLPASATTPEQGTAEGEAAKVDAPKDVKGVYALWLRAKKTAPGRVACRAANTAVKTAASATIVGSVTWLWDDPIGTGLYFLQNDLVNIFSHMFHPFYTQGVRDKADKLVRGQPAQKVLAKIKELVDKFSKSKGKK
jgi:hypothetical protein